MSTTGLGLESESVPEFVFHNVNEPSITLTDTTNKFSSSIKTHTRITQIITDSYYTNQLQLFSEFVAVELPIPCWVPTMVLRALARNAPRTTLVTLRSEKSAGNTKFICTIFELFYRKKVMANMVSNLRIHFNKNYLVKLRFAT